MSARNRGSDWRPIGTAPKDGTTVLLWMPTWYQGTGGFAVGMWFATEWVTIPLGRADPTHWMPLPDPPEIEAGEGS